MSTLVRDVSHAPLTHVVVCDRRANELASYIATRRPDVVCRLRTGRLSDEDRQWAGTVVGFRAAIDLGDSAVRWVHSTGAGVDGVLGEQWPREVVLTRTIGALGHRIAEYCVGHALAFSQRVLAFHDNQTRGKWEPVEPTVVQNTRAVIIGTGSVGTAIGKRFHGLGCTPIGVSRQGHHRPPFKHVYPVTGLSVAVETAQWLVIAAPLTPHTRGVIGRAVLRRCRGAFVINVARGGLLDTSALLEGLKDGSITGAALDVFEEEPLDRDSPLWAAPGVVITPHIAGVTHVDEAGDAFLEALGALERGARPTTAVDPTRGY